MTELEMLTKLKLYKGIGVKTKRADGGICYFYEDFSNEDLGINRAMNQLYPLQSKGIITSIEFISNELLMNKEEIKKLESENKYLFNQFTGSAHSRSGKILEQMTNNSCRIKELKEQI